MKTMAIALLFLAFVLSGCTATASTATAPQPVPESISVLIGAADGPRLPGVSVYKIDKEGVELLGYSDPLGKFQIKPVPADIQEWFALLICKEYFFCGAIQLHRKPIKTRYQIRLAPFSA